MIPPGCRQPGGYRCVDRARASRADSDEHYVLDPCDGVLGVVGRRQQRFDWLRGEPSAGRPHVLIA